MDVERGTIKITQPLVLSFLLKNPTGGVFLPFLFSSLAEEKAETIMKECYKAVCSVFSVTLKSPSVSLLCTSGLTPSIPFPKPMGEFPF